MGWLTATNCVSGEVLATEQATAAGKEEILDALAKVTSSLPNKLGESLASIQKYDVPVRAAAAYEKARRYRMLPSYWRGYALIAAKRPTDAINEFQTILSHRPVAGMQWPLAHVGLARAYAAAGNAAGSRKAYEDFFALWKDADPDVPILSEAKKAYAALK